MEEMLRDVYDSLVPADQLIVDTMIMALVDKDRQITRMAKHINGMLTAEKRKPHDETGKTEA